MAKMTESDLLRIVEAEEHNSLGFMSSRLATQREVAMEYYMGELFGNEVEGRSQVVSRDVMDTIEWIMPSIVRIFTSGDQIVRFEPQGPEDMATAQQATDYVNYIFQRQNEGFAVLHNWFKDALLQKNGFVKVYWEEYTDSARETYNGLTDDEFTVIMQAEEVEAVEHTEYDGPSGKTHDVVLRRSTKSGKICVENVPPEEVLVKRQARSLKTCGFVAHRSKKTLSELKEMGFDVPEDVGSDDDQEFNQEHIARHRGDDEMAYSGQSEWTDLDKSRREIWLTEAYIKVDYDGDGIAELRQVIKAGKTVFSNEEVDRIPFVTITPILMPHKMFGLSIADLILDLQYIKSTIWRQLLDNMYLQNNQRYMALDGMVNLDDLMISRPGGIVRVKTFDAVKPLPASPVPAGSFNLLEYTDTVRENRTGVTRYNQGIDADSLNKTASGISQIMSASQQRIDLIARVFAETGVKDLFWAILELTQKHANKPQMMRLNNQFVPVDPRQWSNRFDMTVSVGLGTGSKEKTLQTIQTLMQIQGAALQAGVPIVTPVNIYNASMEFTKAAELKGGDLYFTNPEQAPPQQQGPDPAIATEQIKAQTAKELAQMKIDAGMMKTLIQAEVKKQMQAMQHQHEDTSKQMDQMHEARIHAADTEFDHTHAAMDRTHEMNMERLGAALMAINQPKAPQ